MLVGELAAGRLDGIERVVALLRAACEPATSAPVGAARLALANRAAWTAERRANNPQPASVPLFRSLPKTGQTAGGHNMDPSTLLTPPRGAR